MLEQPLVMILAAHTAKESSDATEWELIGRQFPEDVSSTDTKEDHIISEWR